MTFMSVGMYADVAGSSPVAFVDVPARVVSPADA